MFQNSTLPSAVDMPHSLPHTQTWRAIKRAVRMLPMPQTARDYLVWVVIMAAIAGMVSMQILLSMRIQQTQLVLNDLTSQYVAVEQENAEILWQISQFTHLERIQTEAQRMGYGPGLNPEYRWVEIVAETPPPALAHASTAVNDSGSATIQLSESDPIGGWFERSWQRFQTLWHTDSVPIGVLLREWTGDRF
ncbi:hypothetical protein GC175_25045 [bacterium]|nr:hypothetical protein [bacterium]